ncbi:Xanthine/uracil/vitamin C permease [Sesbania bispinosa]|nr:Xanthine/uracil/vitamin C permease [Sesbania bispinosa]
MSDSDPKARQRPGPWPPAPAPDTKTMPPSSWAKKTGFKPKFSGETNAVDSGQISLPPKPREPNLNSDLEAGRVRAPPPQPVNGVAHREKVPPLPPSKDQVAKKRRDSDGVPSTNGQATTTEPPPPPRRTVRNEDVVGGGLPQTVDDDGFVSRHSHMKYELRDSPGLVPIGVYGIQHYVSILGSLILIPLVLVPAMGGTHEDTSAVVSTVLFVSGVTTLLHTTFGSRLPLIQGPSFVYLAPALAIINSPEFQGLNGNKFKHIMKELQGAIIIGSAFQTFLGYTGLMSLLVRLINPVVVSPTIAAVGLSFFGYGFPLVGTCLEIGAVQILVVIVFSLYLRKISVLGHRIFLIYAVPLGLAITWAVAFLLTEAGVYNYKGVNFGMESRIEKLERSMKAWFKQAKKDRNARSDIKRKKDRILRHRRGRLKNLEEIMGAMSRLLIETHQTKGEDTFRWLSRVERYFQMKGVTEEERLQVIMEAMDGKALPWFRWWEYCTHDPTWAEFKDA